MRFGKTILRSACLLLGGFCLLTLAACGGANNEITPPTISLTTHIPSPTNDSYPSGLQVKGTVDDPQATLQISATPADILSDVNATAPDWSFTLSNLVEGANLITIAATDAKGNANTAYIPIILDSTPPPLLLGPVSTVTPNTAQTIGGITENGATVQVTVDTLSDQQVTPVSPADAPYGWEENISGLAEGVNTVTVTATDKAGNANLNPVTTTITLDPSAPDVAIDPISPAVLKSNLTLTGTVQEGATVTVSASGATVSDLQQSAGTWSGKVSGLPKGESTPVTVTATDASGNVGTAEVDLVYNTAPTVTSTVPTANRTDASVNTAIQAVFDQPVLNVATSFTLKNSAGDAVQGTVSYDSASNTATFTPSSPLLHGNTYKATLSNRIINVAGTALAPTSWSFSTTYQ